MGRIYDQEFARLERQAHTSGVLNGMTKAQRKEHFAKLALEAQAYEKQQLGQALSGQTNVYGRQLHGNGVSFAEMSKSWGQQPNAGRNYVQQPVAPIVPDLQLSTTNNGFTVKGKTQVGKGAGAKYFLKDAQGNVYQVDKAAYNAASKGKNIKLAGAAAKPVDVASIPRQARNNLRVTGNATQGAQQAAGTNQFGRPVHGSGVSFREMSQSWDGKTPGAPKPPVDPGNVVPKPPVNNVRVVTTPRDTRINAGLIDDSFGGYKDSPLTEYYRNGGKHAFEAIDDITPPKPPVNPGNTTNNFYTTVINTVDDAKLNNIADKVDDIGKNVGKLTDKVDDIGKGLGKLTDKVNVIDNGLGKLSEKVTHIDNGVTKLTDKVDDLANLVKSNNKKVALVAGAAALTGALVGGLIAWGINKAKDEKDAAKGAEEAKKQPEQPVQDEIVSEKEHKFTMPTPEMPKIEIPEFKLPELDYSKKPEATTEAKAEEKAEEKTEYKTVKGDSFWKIAERNLKEKYAKEPEKFENLTTEQKNRLIYKETVRLMDLNGYKFDENKWFPEPMLHPDVKIKLTDKVDVAA